MEGSRIEEGPASRFGWLRRPELDGPDYEAWELPDGRVWAVRKGARTPVLRRRAANLSRTV